MDKPLISVIIPAYNEEKHISRCIETLLSQTYRDLEIIVVDDGSTDGTREMVKQFPVRLLEQNHKGPGAARNLGAKIAKGEILVFVDADMEFESRYVEELVKPIIAGEAIGTEHFGERLANEEKLLARFQGRPQAIDDGRSEVFRAIKRDVFLNVRGFDLELDYADDRSLLEKVKQAPVRVTSAICYHYNADTFKEIFYQFRWRYTSYLKQNDLTFKYLALLSSSVLIVLFLVAIFIWYFIVGVIASLALFMIAGAAGAIKFKDARALFLYPLYLSTLVAASIAALLRYSFSRTAGK